MSTNNIANETVKQARNAEPFSFYKLITNTYFLNVVSLTAFFLLWDYVAYAKVFRDSLARPTEVWDMLVRLSNMKFAGTDLWGHIWASMQRILVGFTIAAVVAVPLGLFMALNKYVNAIVKPLFDLFKPMPPIAWVSLAILWFGIGEFFKVFIIVIGTFVPCLLNAYNGVRIVDPDLYDVIRVLGGNRRHVPLQRGMVYCSFQKNCMQQISLFGRKQTQFVACAQAFFFRLMYKRLTKKQRRSMILHQERLGALITKGSADYFKFSIFEKSIRFLRH